jgi:hypothetical protein
MPTIEHFKQFRIVVYSNDHRPTHVHVLGQEGEAVFQMHCPHGPLELREVFRLSRRQVSDIGRRLGAWHASLCQDWRTLHGHH